MTGGPAGRRDESVGFSLRELQELEEDRIAREKRAAKERETAAIRAREEAARREAEELAAKERVEAEAREAERRRELEDLARREAVQKAIVEQARIEVDAKTRAQERDRERAHELELARLRAQQSQTKPGAIIGAGLGGAALVFALAIGIHLGVMKPSSEARIAAVTDMATRAEQRANDAERRVEAQAKKIDELNAQLSSARTQTKAPDPPPRPIDKNWKGPNGPTGPTKTQPKRTGCNPLDPMCFDPP